MFGTNLDMEILKIERTDQEDDDVGVIGIQFKVVNTSLFLLAPPHTMFQSMGAPFLRRVTASMRDFMDEDMAYHCSSRMLSDVLHVFDPDVIPSVAAEVASILCYWTHHSIQRRFNSLELEVRLDIIEHCHGSYDDDHHDSAAREEQEDAEEREEGEEEEEEEEEDDADIEEEEEEEGALAWATTESMNGGGAVSDGLFGSSSADEVEAFLRSWHAQTWDSKAQCIICLECLGAAGGLEKEEAGDEKGSNEEKKQVRSCQLPCCHLFHEACIRRWFEVSDSCPICRATPMFDFFESDKSM